MKRLCFLVLFLAYGNAFAGSSPHSPERIDQDAIAAAVEPFKREIEMLQEKLENMEARHDTLEAATEQFRIKTREIKEKLETEKARYNRLEDMNAAMGKNLLGDIDELKTRLQKSEDQVASHGDLQNQLKAAVVKYNSLESAKIEGEQTLREEIAKLKALLQESNDRASVLEKSLKTALTDERQKDSLHQEEARKRTEEVKHWEEQMRDVVAENKDLKTTIKQRDHELGEARSTFFTLQQDLLDANERLRGMESENETTLTDLLRSRMRELRGKMNRETLPLLMHWLNEMYENGAILLEDLLEESQEKICTWIELSEQQLSRLMGAVKESYEQIVATSAPELLQPLSTSGPVKEFFKRCEKAHRTIAVHYQKVHQRVIAWMESTITVMASQCLLQDSNAYAWVCYSCLFVKAHSESIILWAEVLLALLCIDFAISTCLSRSQRRQPTKAQTKTENNASLLRKASNNLPPPS